MINDENLARLYGSTPLGELLREFNMPFPECHSHVCKGWESIVRTMFQELIDHGWNGRLAQIKEKFGVLRVYLCGANYTFYKIIDRAVDASAITCLECGKPGRLTQIGYWLATLCVNCEKEANARRR